MKNPKTQNPKTPLLQNFRCKINWNINERLAVLHWETDPCKIIVTKLRYTKVSADQIRKLDNESQTNAVNTKEYNDDEKPTKLAALKSVKVNVYAAIAITLIENAKRIVSSCL